MISSGAPKSFTMSTCIVLLSFTAVQSETVEDETKWSSEIIVMLKQITETAISSDGKLVAYTVSIPIMEGEKSEYLEHIWVVSADGSSDVQFTRGEESCSNPAFSPDGKYLSFTSARGEEPKNQVWLLRIGGGEAEQLTTAKSAVNSYSWSPKGDRIAYTMNDPETEEEKTDKKEKRYMTLVDQNFKYSHLYTITINKNSDGEREITRLTAGAFHVGAFDWSPDAKVIAFDHRDEPTEDNWPTTNISMVPSDSGEATLLVSWSGYDAMPHYSPDGKWLAFLSDNSSAKWADGGDIYIVPAQGGDPLKLPETPDRSILGITGWSSSGKEIYITATNRTSHRIYSLPVNANKAHVVTSGDGNYTKVSLSRNGKVLALVHETPTLAPEVYISGTKKFAPRELTSVSDDYPKLKMGKTEIITWTSPDGMAIEGLLTYPIGYKAGEQHPLIVMVHGGPAWVSTQRFTSVSRSYHIQSFAQKGFAILRPNPRGSIGYGKDFRFAIYNDWGFGDYEDVMSGVDNVIEMGIAHSDSLCIMGWSYGGYMTAFAVTKTDRFKAASMGAGEINLASFTGTTDLHGLLPDYLGGEPWDKADVYLKHSPLFQAKGVTTPTQIFHGESDSRVPISQSQEFYSALRRQGCTTEMIVYPRTGHFPSEPKFLLDLNNRILSWFNKHLGRDSANENESTE